LVGLFKDAVNGSDCE